MKHDAIVAAGHHDRRARADPRRADPAGRARGDGRQDGGRLLHRTATCPTRAELAKPQGARTAVSADPAADAAVAYLRAPAGDPRARRRACWRAGSTTGSRTSASTSPACPPRPSSWPRSRATRYPDLRVPLHSRWRHFDVGGCDRASRARGARWRSARRTSARGRGSTSRSSACCSTPAPGRRGAITRRETGRDVRPLGGPGGGELPPVRPRRLLRRPRRRRGAPTRRRSER